jgi:hypothetical protein
MRKLVCMLWIAVFTLQISNATATGLGKKLTLKIDFYSTSEGSSSPPLHIKKTVIINTAQDTNTILMTKSKIENNFPITLTMLVKTVEITKKQVDLRFNLLQYGFNQRGSVITQPRVVLSNGQSIEMKNALYTLKVKAKWV